MIWGEGEGGGELEGEDVASEWRKVSVLRVDHVGVTNETGQWLDMNCISEVSGFSIINSQTF